MLFNQEGLEKIASAAESNRQEKELNSGKEKASPIGTVVGNGPKKV